MDKHNLHPIDAVLQQAVPTVMVPRYNQLEPLMSAGHRFLACANGLWLEVRQAWLHMILPVALQSRVSMPYGSVKQMASISSIPATLIKVFQEFAREQLPNECAAHIILNIETGAMRLQCLKPTSVGRGHVDVTLDALPPSEVLVLDIHSHGFHDPYFSKTDNEDDKTGVKVAGVISFSRNDPNTAHADLRCRAVFRLCVNGMYFDLQARSEGTHYQFSTIGEQHGTSSTS